MKKLFAIITVMLLVAMLTVTASAAELRADLDGDGAVTKDDAIYLLMYTFFPDEYPIPCTEHSEVTDKAVESTCSEEGLTEGSHCEVCGKVFTEQTPIDKLPHTEGEWTVAKEPTTTEVGKRVLSCSVCGETMKEEDIPAIDVSGLSYEVNDDGKTCTIVGVGTLNTTEVYIPESIQGYKVTAIGDKAFENCSELTYISIPETVTSIGTRAFYGCTGLTNITIPESVTSIGTQIFYKCDNLSTVYYNSAYVDLGNKFLNLSQITKVVFCGKTVPSYILQNHANIKEVVIKEGVTSIGNDAFEGCTNLTRVEIPDSVTSISNWTFSGCTSLTSIDIPDSVTSIGVYAFSGCTSLTSIEIPDSVTSISNWTFSGCTSLKKVYITDLEAWMNIEFDGADSNPCYYGAELYLNNELVTSVVVPNTINTIGNGAFYNCTSLTSIEIPDSVTSIGNYAFSGCNRLTSIEIPDSVTSIGERTFYNCTSLTSIEIPNSVTSIGSSAFSGCNRLTSIEIPDSVKSIGNSAFRDCTSLTSIEIPDSVTSIGNSAFYDCYKLVEVINRSSLNITKGSSGNGYVAYYALEVRKDGESKIVNKDNYLFYTDTSVNNYLLGYVGDDTELILPDNYNGQNYRINNYAFCRNVKITSVVIPDSVTSIGYWAFAFCENLANTKYNGTITQWESVLVDWSWRDGVPYYILDCTDGFIGLK